MRLTSVAIALLFGVLGLAAEKPDQLSKGSVWKGEGELADGKIGSNGLRLSDFQMKITERMKDKLKGEIFVDKGSRGFAFDGTVVDGNIQFVFRKAIKGEWDKRWTDRTGTVTIVSTLLACEFGGSQKKEPADREHFKVVRQGK